MNLERMYERYNQMRRPSLTFAESRDPPAKGLMMSKRRGEGYPLRFTFSLHRGARTDKITHKP